MTLSNIRGLLGFARPASRVPDPKWVRNWREIPSTAPSGIQPPEAFLPYPQGWFCIGFSYEWQPGAVHTRSFAGKEVVVYRTHRGAMRAISPYCPHLGAHLGVGGRVFGEDLVCPFHQFAFGTDGSCVRTPYGPPPRANLDQLPLRESNGIVFLWHSPHGGPPTWEVPEVSTEGFSPLVCRTTALIGHPQEVCENSVDYGHFVQLHGFSAMEATSPPVTDGPFFNTEGFARSTVPGLGNIDIDNTMKLWGLGCVKVTGRLPEYGVVIHTWGMPTPVAPWKIHFRIATSCSVEAPKYLPEPLRSATSRNLAKIVCRKISSEVIKVTIDDLAIWQHKKYLTHPRLIKGDGPIGPFRQWARQFYPPADTE